MRFFPFLAVTLSCLASPRPLPADLAAEISAQASAARAILDGWHAEGSRPSERTLHLVYWTPSDREPAPAYRERLTRIFEDIRGFYSREMERIGFGARTIRLDYAADKQLRIHLVRGAKPYAEYDVQSGSTIRTECLPTLREAGIDPDRETIVIFCNMGEWDAERKTIRHRSPYYAGGNARGGTAWQLDSPILDTENLKLKEPIIRDGQYGRISLGKHNSIFIGGVAHELGHALGLPHNRQRPDEQQAFGTALMGSGNQTYGDQLRQEGRGSFLTLAHAMRLASHPQFSGSVKGLFTPANATLDQFAVEVGEASFKITGRARSAVPVYAVVGYMDPEGGGDYDATTTTAVPDANGEFSLSCGALRKGKSAELRVVACLANGATIQSRFQYSVGEDGRPDLSSLQQKLALAPVVAAINSRDKKQVTDALAKIGDPQTRAIAGRLATPPQRSAMPSQIEADQVLLADTKPASEEVGWLRPSYNRLPDRNLILESGGQIFPSGIYAHAPARHLYQLGGTWARLTGKCGLASSSRGSVVFVIRVDGIERWRSPLTRPGTLHDYSIDLDAAESLELSVEDGGDGSGSDWGLWLNPLLEK